LCLTPWCAKSRYALTRRAAVFDQFVVHVIWAKLELQVLKVGRFSIGWFISTARLVKAYLDFRAHVDFAHQWFLQMMHKHIFWPNIDCSSSNLFCYRVTHGQNVTYTPNRWAWSLSDTWQRWQLHHPIGHGPKPLLYANIATLSSIEPE